MTSMNTASQITPRILLVEDNPTDVLLTQRAFGTLDLDVELMVASDGEVAMEMLSRFGDHGEEDLPDLILLDINMPRKDGKQVLREIKASESLRHVPVMMLTTSDSRRDVVESYQLFANAYAVKPSNPKAFRDMVKSIETFWFETVILERRLT